MTGLSIRRWALAATAVATVALTIVVPARANEFVRHFGGPGTGNGQFSQPIGVAIDPATGALYVADTTRNLVEKFDASGNFQFSFGGAGSGPGQFNGARGVAVDPQTGDVYVVDLNNNRVQQFDSAGNFELQFGSAGSGPGQFNHPSMVAVDPSNRDVYVTDVTNNRVEKFDPSGNFLSQFGTVGTGSGQFSAPNGIAIDPAAGDVYVTDFNNQRVQKFNSSGAFLSAFGSAGSGPGQFGGPFAVAIDGSTGDVYVSDGNRRVEKFDAAGNYLSQFGSAGSGNGQLNGPGGVATDLNGSVYVADGTNARVDEFDSSGGFLSEFGGSGTGSGQFSNALGAAVDPGSGELYVVDGGPANRVEKFTSSGAFESLFGATGTGNGQFTNPHGPAVDGASGDSYVVDSGNNRVQRFDPSGNFINLFGGAGTGNGQFSSPLNAAVDPSTRDVYVTDESNHRVEKFGPTGTFLSTFGTNGTGQGQFSAPLGVAVDTTDGSTYVGDVTGNRVQKFDSSGNYLLRFGGTGAGSGQFSAPKEIVVNPASRHVFVLDSANARVEEFDARGRYLSQFGAPGNVAGQFNAPDGLALDPLTGAIYVVTVGGSTHIQKFGAPPAPMCASATGFTTEAFPVGIQLSCTASAGFSPNYQVATGPAHGTVSSFDPFTGFFLYTPDPGFVGTDTLTYHGFVDGSASPDLTVRITVAAVPRCHDVSASVGEGGVTGVQLDCTQDGGGALTYAIDSPPAHGTLGTVSPSGALTYSADAGFTGADSFTYHATNADGVTSGEAVAHISVNPPPSCEDADVTTPAGKTTTVTFNCFDVTNAPFNYDVLTNPAHGTLGPLHQSTGTISYTPDPGYSGPDSFTFFAATANGNTNTATVHITVNAPPACQDVSALTAPDHAVQIGLSCADATGAGVTYTIVAAPSHGSLAPIQQGAGQVTYTPSSGYTGPDSFTYEATSVNGTSNTATASITVIAPPTCHRVSTATTEDHAASPIQLNCSDAGAATLSYVVDSEPAHGTLGAVNQTTGQIPYAPDSQFSGIDTFTYHATSANGVSSTQTVAVSVRPAVTLTSPAAGSTTNDPTPLFAGTASTGGADASTVTVRVVAGSTLSGSLVQTLQAQVAPGGAWSVSPSTALADGTYTAQARQATSAGVSGLSTAKTFTVDTVAPAVTLTVPAAGSSTNQAKPAFSGAAGTAPGDAAAITVKVFAGSSATGTPIQTLTPTAVSGHWSVTATSALAAGTYTAQARQSDGAGNTGVSLPATFTVDLTAPIVTLSAPPKCATTTNATPTFAGTAGTAGGDAATVTLNLFAGLDAGPPIQTLQASVTAGQWSVVAPSALAAGTYRAQAVQSDAAGNTGRSSTNVFELAIGPLLVQSPAFCGWTNHSTPTISGTARNNSGDAATVTVNVYAGSTTSGTPLQSLGASRSGTAWSLTLPSTLADGAYTVQAIQVLASGSATSPPSLFKVDTVAPAVTLTTPANGTTTSNPSPTFSGAAGTATGDRPTVTLKIFAGSTATGTPLQTRSATVSSGHWSTTPSSPLSPGTYTAQASQSDAAGNTGTSSPATFTVT